MLSWERSSPSRPLIAIVAALALWGCASRGTEDEGQEQAVDRQETGQVPPPSDEDVPPENRQVYLIEFNEPYTQSDLAWLEEQGGHVMSQLSDRSLTAWFVPRSEHPWARDPRISALVPQMKGAR